MKNHPSRQSGFTLIELLTVIAIIAILAGLILSTAGYVQKKGARARAEAEIAAMSAALESYRADNGIYPATSDRKGLYQALSGDGNDVFVTTGGVASNGTWGSEGKAYMELKPNMVTVNASTKKPVSPFHFLDPFGTAYNYRGAGGSPEPKYNPTFDLWSNAGIPAARATTAYDTGATATEGSPARVDYENLIKNW